MRWRSDPIVILGMHRSGTSVLARMLRQLGVFLGSRRNVHEESPFFRAANDRILKISHADWDSPYPVKYLLRDVDASRQAVLELRRSLEGFGFVTGYLGLTGWRGWQGSGRFAWGWKDPRSTLTFPFWHELLPEARYLFIHRNGVDVAASLVRRERLRTGGLSNPLTSLRCRDPADAFALWEEYNDAYLEAMARLRPALRLEVSYEELSTSPADTVSRLVRDLGLAPSSEQTRRANQLAIPDRRHVFRGDPDFRRLYLERRTTTLMKRFGYDEVPVPPFDP